MKILFQILTTCPSVETSKGFHYYFNRTATCDLYALYDHSRCFGFDDKDIDFKTRGQLLKNIFFSLTIPPHYAASAACMIYV